MKKYILALLTSSLILAGCQSATTEVTIDNFGDQITFIPSEEDWCGENCVIYPENGNMYIRVPESGSDIFYPEGTDFQGDE